MKQTPVFTDNSRKIFDMRYPRKDSDGKPSEAPEQVVSRVAWNVASVNALYGDERTGTAISTSEEFPWKTAMRQHFYLSRKGGSDIEFHDVLDVSAATKQADRYYDLIASWDFLPNSPTWTGAGTPLGQLAACFVLPIDDDLATGRGSIFETMKVAALIQQTGGGNGFSFGDLRPSKSIVNRSMGQASGPIGFLKAYDAAFGVIAQGGSRRGANMGVLPVWHPDIEAFIESKTIEGEIANFNISIALTDEFMDAVSKDADFDLRWYPTGPTDDPVDYRVTRTIRARDLWDKIAQNAWVIGDPGNLFIDAANRTNPCPQQYVLKATNPCGEQWLGPYENCCLGSINLANFADWDGGFDWDRFADVVTLSTQFLDDVVDANQYVPAVPELEIAAQGGRRIGLGGMGLADAMLKLGIRYGSEEGLLFASKVTEFARFHTMLASIDRAEQRGTFEWFKGSIYDFHDNEPLIGLDGLVHERWTAPVPLVDGPQDWGRPAVNWQVVQDGIMAHGIRNSCQFTFAPTGTISNVAALEGSGCEPLFALVYFRQVVEAGGNVVLPYASPLFAEALRRAGKNDEQIEAIVALVQDNKGSCQGIHEVPEEIQRVFVVAGDVTWEEHVRTQAVLQRFVDNSISKTINMPNEATVEDVSAAYRLAYDLGCKGITIYRQGSREYEVLSTGKKEIEDDAPVQITEEVWPVIRPMSIPQYASDTGLTAKVFPVNTPFGKVQVTVTELDEHPGRPFDLRIQLGKAGNDKNADVEALGRSISLALRAGVDVAEVIEQLDGIGGQTVTGFGPHRVRSVADGIAKLLKRRYQGATAPETVTLTETVTITQGATLPGADPERTCPRCNLASVIVESGCAHCDMRLGGCGEWEGCE
jgi:ribonucleoside-diphosphate reductase alpha chain